MQRALIDATVTVVVLIMFVAVTLVVWAASNLVVALLLVIFITVFAESYDTNNVAQEDREDRGLRDEGKECSADR